MKSSDVSHTARTQIQTLEDKLATNTGINNELRADKANLQKQLELVTLRLLSPGVGFWAGLFGKKEQELLSYFEPLA